MKVKHIPNKQRREESTARIVDSAIKIFGIYGFTNSSVSHIAREASVSPGLITNRYETKADLFMDAFNKAFSRVSLDADNVISAREFIINMVQAIVNLYNTDYDSFRFIMMLHGNPDIPEESDAFIRQAFEQSRAFLLLEEAQRQEMIPDGDIFNLLDSFLAHVFIQIGVCKKHNVNMPNDDYFLSIFPFEDQQIKLKRMWDEIFAELITGTYESIAHIYNVKNTGEVLNNTDYSVTEVSNDVRSRIIEIVTERVCEEDLQKVLDFFDFSTINERIGEKRSISCPFLTKDGKKYRHILTPLVRNDEGCITEVIAFVQDLTM